MSSTKPKTSIHQKEVGQKSPDRQKQTIDRLVAELDVMILQYDELQESAKYIVKKNDELNKYSNEVTYRNENLVKENLALKEELRRWRKTELHTNDTVMSVVKNQAIIHNLIKNIYIRDNETF